MSRLTIIFNTRRGARSIYDLFLTNPPRTEAELLSVPLVQYSSVIRAVGDVPACLKHKHASLLVEELPQIHKLVQRSTAPHIPLKHPSLLHTFAIAAQYSEEMLRTDGKLLSVRKAKRVLKNHWVSDTVSDAVLQAVRTVFREPLPKGIEHLAVIDYLHTRTQPHKQLTPKQVLQTLEDMAIKYERARTLFAFTAAWARNRLPGQPLFACVPDYNSLYNLLSIFMNGDCNLQQILRAENGVQQRNRGSAQ